MAAGLRLQDFPELKIDTDNVSGSWKNWLSEFELNVELVTLKLGTEKVSFKDSTGNDQIKDENVFRGRIKLLALLHAIGKEGRDIKNMRFVTATQAAGENEGDYLLRIEKLSRTLNFGGDNNIRKEFSLAIAVNGLRESSLRRQLMQRNDLDWEGLTNTLRARNLARESEIILQGSKSSRVQVKHEVAAIKSKLAGNSQLSSDSHDEEKVCRISSSRYRRNRHYDRPRERSSSRERYESSRRKDNRDSESRYRSSRDYDRSSRESSGDLFQPEWRRSDRYHFRNKSSRSSRDYPSPKKGEECFKCNSRSHQVRNCPYIRCYNCNEKGHTVQGCPIRESREMYSRYRDRRRESSSSGSRSPITRVRFVESKPDS